MAGAASGQQANQASISRSPGGAGRGTTGLDRGFENSLTVLSTVMSVPRAGMAVCDAGLKAMTFESGPPRIDDPRGVRYAGPSDEHGNLELATGVALLLGQKLRLVPGFQTRLQISIRYSFFFCNIPQVFSLGPV